MRLSKKSTISWATAFAHNVPDRAPMRQAEFKQLCGEMDINDSATAAELFGLSWRTCQRYWYGETDIPGPLARLLRLASMTNTDLRKLAPKSSRR